MMEVRQRNLREKPWKNMKKKRVMKMLKQQKREEEESETHQHGRLITFQEMISLMGRMK